MSDEILRSFLEHQAREAGRLVAASDLLELQPVEGDPPRRYIARFRARGLVRDPSGEIGESDLCDIGIWLPDDYLRRADARQVLTYLGPSPRPWHPNIAPPFICMSVRPATPLVDLLYALFELWTWNLRATHDPLNWEAASWALSQDPARFPVDRRPLRRRRLPDRVEVAREGGDS
jgi:hypothetical protein